MCQRNFRSDPLVDLVDWLIGRSIADCHLLQHRASLWRSDPWIGKFPRLIRKDFFFVTRPLKQLSISNDIAKKLTKNIPKNARTKLLAFVTSSCTIPFLTQCWCPQLGIQGCLANERWDCYMAYAGERTAFTEKLRGHVQLSLVSVHSQKKHILNYINTMVVNLY